MSGNLKIDINLFSYGGVDEETVDSILGEVQFAAGLKDVKLSYGRISGDALITRSRSRVASSFLERNSSDVLFMIDRDVSWNPGDLVDTASLAHEMNSIVGGLYSKRSFGGGFSSRIPIDKMKENPTLKIGEKGIVEADCVATGFMAIPRHVLFKILTRLERDHNWDPGGLAELDHDYYTYGDWPYIEKVYDGPSFSYYDFFSCFVSNHTVLEGKREFLSEDWAFCRRWQMLGGKCYISTKPVITHKGDYGFLPSDAVKGRGGE